MRIFVNREPRQGPWGGGNKTLAGICEFLRKEGHEVFFDLVEGLDVLVCFDPRPDHRGIWYQTLWDYKQRYGSKIVQRVGDLGTHSKPELFDLVKQTIPHSDAVIFPSIWARNHSQHTGNNFNIIPNRPSPIFYDHSDEINTSIHKIPRVVTHHWSNNPLKGFDIYRIIDEEYSGLIDFTYIGRLPDGFSFNNSTHISPIDDQELSKRLPKYDFYLTASRLEAGANHVLEALACKLPVVYHTDGGSITEYVGEYGIGYNDKSSLAGKARCLLTVKQFTRQ